MAIIRAARPADHFTMIRNDVLRDERLSYRARGVLAVILSRPDAWSTSSEALARTGSEGRDAIRTALTELEEAGYLVREKRRDDRGRWATQAMIYDQPQTDAWKPGVGRPTPGNPASDSQALSTKTVQEEPSPTERGRTFADEVSKAVYDHAEGMVRYIAVRQIVAKALKNGNAPEAVQAACVALYDEGRPLTLQTVGQRLAGAGAVALLNVNADHWATGGAFDAAADRK